MDLCLMIEGQEGVSWPQWLALARACEEQGIPALFRSDHYLNVDGQHPEREVLDAWSTLSALAAVTSTVRLGTLVSPVTFRHPSLLAKAVATVDEISGGRAELGLGAGWHEREHVAYGFPFPPTRVRMDMLTEQLQVVLGSWGEGPFTFRGEHYMLHALDARPKPVQRRPSVPAPVRWSPVARAGPHPPLIMGGAAGPRSAALAAQFADEYNTAFATLEDVLERRARITQACKHAGREPMPFSVMTCVLVGADETELRDRAGRLAERLGTHREALLSTPPPGWIVGTVEQATEQLLALRDAGTSRVMCQNLLHDDLDAVALIGRRLAPAMH